MAGQTDLIRSLTADSVLLSIDILFRGTILLQDASDCDSREAAIERHDGSRGVLEMALFSSLEEPALLKSTVGCLLCEEHVKGKGVGGGGGVSALSSMRSVDFCLKRSIRICSLTFDAALAQTTDIIIHIDTAVTCVDWKEKSGGACQ